jgi:hypothetical protein
MLQIYSVLSRKLSSEELLFYDPEFKRIDLAISLAFLGWVFIHVNSTQNAKGLSVNVVNSADSQIGFLVVLLVVGACFASQS